MKKIPWPLIIIIILSLFALRPLFFGGFFSFHDDQQVARLFELNKSLLGGQFPVRWVEGLGFGLGYPLFNFYPPFVYYLGEIIHLFGFNFLDSVKIVWGVAIVGSGLAMYFLAKEFFGKIGGVISALFYVYAPYHAVDAYVRGALSELFAFVWLPLILLFTYKKRPVITGILLALLMLTHNLTFLPFFGFWTIWFFVFDRSPKRYLLTASLCFLLTAFFWIPSLYEKQFTLVDQILTKDLASYGLHFVCLNQLWDGVWGFGASLPGCIDGMSFKIGKLHILTSILSLFVAMYLWIKNQRFVSILILSSFFFLLSSLFMTTEYSKFIWDLVSPLWYIQFPWRFLIFSSLFSSLLAGSIFLMVTNRYLRYCLLLFLLFLLILFNAKLFVPREYLPQMTNDQFTSDAEIKWRVSGTSFEYLPKGIATEIRSNGTTGVNISKSEIRNTKFETITGKFETQNEAFKPGYFKLVGFSPTGATVQLTTTNFPGWKVWVDGVETKFSDDNKFKLITVSIPSGNHEIIAKFTDTPVRTAGNLITVASLIGLTGFYFKKKYAKNII